MGARKGISRYERPQRGVKSVRVLHSVDNVYLSRCLFSPYAASTTEMCKMHGNLHPQERYVYL